jgi:histidine triad (HIT) family protein
MKIYDKNNLFAKIIRGEIKSDKVYEDDDVLAFYDISKAAPIHVLVVPKGEYINFSDFATKAKTSEIANFFRKVSEIAEKLGVDKQGFRLITNNGADSHQTIEHFHVHILAGKKLGPLLTGDKNLR